MNNVNLGKILIAFIELFYKNVLSINLLFTESSVAEIQLNSLDGSKIVFYMLNNFKATYSFLRFIY